MNRLFKWFTEPRISKERYKELRNVEKELFAIQNYMNFKSKSLRNCETVCCSKEQQEIYGIDYGSTASGVLYYLDKLIETRSNICRVCGTPFEMETIRTGLHAESSLQKSCPNCSKKTAEHQTTEVMELKKFMDDVVKTAANKEIVNVDIEGSSYSFLIEEFKAMVEKYATDNLYEFRIYWEERIIDLWINDGVYPLTELTFEHFTQLYFSQNNLLPSMIITR